MVDCGVKGPLFYNNVPTSTALFNVRYKLEETQYRPVVEQGGGCLAQLIRQLRIGQLGGPPASHVCARMCVCVCVCVKAQRSVMMLTVVGPLAW